jgi:hypothetical protein
MAAANSGYFTGFSASFSAGFSAGFWDALAALSAVMHRNADKPTTDGRNLLSLKARFRYRKF